ncbi:MULTISPECIES: hypothetical protein [unclassified Pseudoalteromonas]|uniref:hypothetical protein n=1 Tax=unclassified Pseudoalteromonas TaxID=194690 RepID=UPI0025B2C28F|nr:MULTISPECIES: hypothetical protein [unclassified Pseudoalteromonas]MDN3395147.1 hypothetical protein [Pseudoalteromonas sp. APC 3215]MDN3400081.1 hypothetical protein [Pseudoalteromonas sp. APC 3213]MDN3429348.1 hypothetical protein [Pseudoalteromonas sp. APC 3907]MDN3464415.1 hypothetical protein [Pseudoalteromonas sp. APC 3495]MDN3471091.1 hypothetical protein [Pseudoalteromonas sp. APC 4026]
MSNSQLQKIISLYTAFVFIPTLLLYLIYSIFGWVVFSLTLNPILGYFLLGGAYGLWSLHSLIKTMKNLTVLKHPIIVKLGLLLGCSFCPVVLTTAEFSTMKPQEFIFIYIIIAPFIATFHLFYFIINSRLAPLEDTLTKLFLSGLY